ncbi:CCR4-NOT transcription complex subunit 3-like isoform X2 [Tachypleus tridentatus]|uniref:CCR4-NOT transcription complex subunit 3-like isoform X2 n=1 Tax=Tachypleus tridentatus TaxID=6853 RepID=UPI003FD14FDE
MADRRKLLGEIERCLKKVTEGVETFEDIWQKVQSAGNYNQKEKYEGDLKKEIKKLQRLRDQIKMWVASNEIKDKRDLTEARKLIERQMERFKVVERETKTKAYSKEGLEGTQKVDPAQKEKDDASSWLSASIEALNLQIDQFESEYESLVIELKKKRSDKEKEDRLDELKGHTKKHRYHVKQLETIMRMVDNNTVDVDQVKKIKDDVEYYIDSCQEPDFEDNEFIYSDLNLEDIQEYLTKREDESCTTPTSVNSGSPESSPTNYCRTSEIIQPVAVWEHNLNSVLSCTAQPNRQSAASRKNSTSSQSSSSSTSSTNNCRVNHSPIVPLPMIPYAVAATVTNQNSSSTERLNGSECTQVNCVDSSSSSYSTTSLTPSVSPVGQSSPPTDLNLFKPTLPSVNNISSITASLPSSDVFSILPSSTVLCDVASQSSIFTLPNNGHLMNIDDEDGLHQHSLCNPLLNGPLRSKPLTESPMSSLKTMAQQALLNAGLQRQLLSPQSFFIPTDRELFNTTNSVRLQSNTVEPISRTSANNVTQITMEIDIPPLLGVAPLGPVPLTKNCFYQSQMLEASSEHVPHPSDSERLRLYFPRNLCPTPSYYPQSIPNCDSIDFFQRLSVETLFFIFYYMEGTKAQHLAEKALKKQSWRFHTEHMMWFQRHEEPKTINDEFEQGTYIYFDYEKWGQRKKEGFIFEYKFLEDRDLN